jgi:hypothetical protein
MCDDDDRFAFDSLEEELRIPGGVLVSTLAKTFVELLGEVLSSRWETV